MGTAHYKNAGSHNWKSTRCFFKHLPVTLSVYHSFQVLLKNVVNKMRLFCCRRYLTLSAYGWTVKLHPKPSRHLQPNHSMINPALRAFDLSASNIFMQSIQTCVYCHLLINIHVDKKYILRYKKYKISHLSQNTSKKIPKPNQHIETCEKWRTQHSLSDG